MITTKRDDALTLLSFALVFYGFLMWAAAVSASPKSAAAVAVAAAAVDIGDQQPDLPDNRERIRTRAVEPMQFNPVQSATIVDERMEVTVHSATWCSHCLRMKADNGDGDERIRFIYTDEPAPGRSIPCSVFTDCTGARRYFEGYYSTQSAWDKIQRNNPPTVRNQTIAASGFGGTIKGSSQIRQSFDWWKSNIGESVKASAQWDRTGGQTFPLLAKGDWSALAVFGRYGHVSLSAKGAKGLTVDSLGFGYRVDGDDITLDLDPVTLKGFGMSLEPDIRESRISESAGFGPTTIITILQVARGVWSLLNPTCDLQLGGNVSATAVLTGDVLAIDFQQAPSIKIVALFTFQLSVNRVEISERNIHVEFGGSRLIKSRDFVVGE